jgi:hypothetical protein
MVEILQTWDPACWTPTKKVSDSLAIEEGCLVSLGMTV